MKNEGGERERKRDGISETYPFVKKQFSPSFTNMIAGVLPINFIYIHCGGIFGYFELCGHEHQWFVGWNFVEGMWRCSFMSYFIILSLFVSLQKPGVCRWIVQMVTEKNSYKTLTTSNLWILTIIANIYMVDPHNITPVCAFILWALGIYPRDVGSLIWKWDSLHMVSHPMVTFFRAHRMNAHCLVMICINMLLCPIQIQPTFQSNTYILLEEFAKLMVNKSCGTFTYVHTE